MNHIKIGTVSMPVNDFVVSRNAILGITKSGKTYTAKSIAEQMLAQKIPIIVFDAIGVWRFLKVPGNGNGFQVVVAGGMQPDLPLTPHSAPEIVRAAIRENIPLIIDLYDPKLSKADWRRIVQESFRILLYENVGLRHVFLEEAAEYAPQKVMDGQTYAEVEKLARMGGNRSVGITFINQRAQELNKAVLELCDNIILLRQRGTHAIDSLERQMDKLSPSTAKDIALSMPNMKAGECWVFTENGDDPVRTRSAPINSYHPDRRNPDETKISAKPVNTDQFVQAMSGKLTKIIEESKLNDPAELRREIIRLKNELESKPISKSELKEVPVLTDHERTRLTKLIETFQSFTDNLNSVRVLVEEISISKDEIAGEVNRLNSIVHGRVTQPLVQAARIPVKGLVSKPSPSKPFSENGTLGKCERELLSALAKYGPCNRQKLILLAGYCWSGSTQNALGKLRSLGYVDGQNDSIISITESGNSSGAFDPLPCGSELKSYWLNFAYFGKCERQILAALFHNPDGLDRDGIMSVTGYAWSGSTQNALGALRTAGVIVGKNNEIMRVAPEILNEVK